MVAVQNWLEKESLKTRLIMQVHDELVLEVADGELALVKESPHSDCQGNRILRIFLTAAGKSLLENPFFAS